MATQPIDDDATVVSMDGVDAALAARYMRVVDEHRALVARYMLLVADALTRRAAAHDRSKLGDEEFWPYARQLPHFERAEYGTPEYKACLRAIKPAIDHHFAANDHHPEHFERGVDGMNLVHLIEMTCDWIAATQRGEEPGEGVLRLDLNAERYKIGDQLMRAIERTVYTLIAGEIQVRSPRGEG